MTESDKQWLDERFARIHDKIDPYCTRLEELEKKTTANSKFIWLLTGAGTLAGALISMVLGLFQFEIRR